METYSSETQNGFEKNLDWLNRWACARTYGLGSKLPWDPKFLVESLSDSTIYMAYYTIAHFLHSDIFGTKPGLINVKPEQMIDEVWDYLFCRRELNEELLKACGILRADLESMRREFEYWYPLDLNSSGKDLIPNHLTFFLYIHIALFPKEYWPKSVRANGHLLLNGEKMSKSTGNFLTLNDGVKKYGADACRIALADAGDGVEDANFEEAVANQIILRMYTLKEWCEEVVKDKNLRTGPTDELWDQLFDNEMNALVHEARQHYKATDYKSALKSSLYDFTSARDFYREATTASSLPMHHSLLHRYILLQALLITPIAPHWADYIYQEVLKHPTTIQNALWPSVPAPNPSLTAAREYVRATSSSITSAEAAQQKRKDKGKNIAFDPKRPKKLTIFMAEKWPSWQDDYLAIVRNSFDTLTLHIGEKKLNTSIQAKGKSEMKRAMPFVQNLKKRLQGGEKAEVVFDRKLGFEEGEVLVKMVKGLRRTTGCKVVEVVRVEGEEEKVGTVMVGEGEGERRKEMPPAANSATPGSPGFHFENVEG